MDKLEKNIKRLITWGGWLVSIIVGLWSLFGLYYNFKSDIQEIQKLTLRKNYQNLNIARSRTCHNLVDLYGYTIKLNSCINEMLLYLLITHCGRRNIGHKPILGISCIIDKIKNKLL